MGDDVWWWSGTLWVAHGQEQLINHGLWRKSPSLSLKLEKSVYVYVYSHFGFKNIMSSLMVSIWTLHSTHPPSLSTVQMSKGGDHTTKLLILHQSPLLILLPPPPSPLSFLLIPLLSDLSNIATVSLWLLPKNNTYTVTVPLNFHTHTHPKDSRRYVSLSNASKPQLTYIRVVTLFTGLIDLGLSPYSGG